MKREGLGYDEGMDRLVRIDDSMKQGEAVPQEVLDDIIRRIVGVARPDKIILFGSAVRGEMGPHSDVDLLVIKSGDYHPGRLTEAIYQNLHGAGAAVDVIVVTPEEVERYRDAFSLVICISARLPDHTRTNRTPNPDTPIIDRCSGSRKCLAPISRKEHSMRSDRP